MPLLDELLKQTPPITRALVIASLLLTLLTHLEIVSGFKFFFNLGLIAWELQIWRLVTHLLFFGELGIHTFFRLLLFYRFSKHLETSSFGSDSIAYFWFLVYGATLINGAAWLTGHFHLADSLMTMIMYYWSRKNQDMMLQVFGIIPVRAPYITWFFMVIEYLIGDFVVKDLIGIIVGHVYFYYVDIYPRMGTGSKLRVFEAPAIL